jgi:L-iditol 2-dehydrogenase
MVHHHIPCQKCFYCRRKVFAQCPVYKKVGVTAGFEPSGGGFAEYVRVMDWIVARGVVRIPDHISYEQASFIEPVNTCLKAIVSMRLEAGESVLVIGQGPIGIMLAILAQRTGARVIGADKFSQRLKAAKTFGIAEQIDVSKQELLPAIKSLTSGRGADATILAVGSNALIPAALDATRPGGRVMLFAQTQHGEAGFDPAAVCVDEKTLLGSYSASIDLQADCADLVFTSGIDFSRLITHRFPLEQAVEALHLAANPQPDSLKVVLTPGSAWKDGQH